MRRRWRLVLGLLFLTSCVAILAVPAVHWRLLGWVRAEAFYLGQPTSYWRSEILRLEVKEIISIYVCQENGEGKVILHLRYYNPSSLGPEPSWQKCLAVLGMAPRKVLPLPPAGSLPAGYIGFEPIPVLLELLMDPDVKVRRFAVEGMDEVWHLAYLLPAPERTVLRQRVELAAADSDEIVRGYAKEFCSHRGRLAEEWHR